MNFISIVITISGYIGLFGNVIHFTSWTRGCFGHIKIFDYIIM